MIKLYRNMEQPDKWTAYLSEGGWVIFPAVENGWERRQPARGLDPIHLREVPLRLAANTGLPEPSRPQHAHIHQFAKVA
jgi:hypothetical protein